MNRRAENIGPKTSATATAARIPFTRHAVGENGAPRRADLQSKRRALQKNVAVENYRIRLNNGPLKRKPEREPRPAASLDEAAP